MTPAQVQLLQRLIAADRAYRSALARGEPAVNDDRGVEVGAINGVDPRTAAALVAAGLAEEADIGLRHPYLFLGQYAALDEPSQRERLRG